MSGMEELYMWIFKALKPLRFLVVLCILNIVLCFFVVPVNGASDTMWNQYYQEEELDTLFVGSSISATTFDPLIFDEILGVKSFNMGTPAQSILQSIEALEIAFGEHDVQTVVLSVGFFSLQEEVIDAAEMSFKMGRAKGKGGLAGVCGSAKWLLSEEVRETEKSINYFFPWLYNNVAISIDGIRENVLSKLNAVADNTSNIMPKGYRPYWEEINLDVIWTENSLYYYSGTTEAQMIAKFEELMELCNSEGVDLVVVNTPHPAQDVVACNGIYREMDKLVRELCSRHGVEYYDFSLAKPELFDSKIEYFADCEHLNHNGAQAFSKMFCDFLQKRQNGEDINQYFYTVDEYYDAHEVLLEEWITFDLAKEYKRQSE